MNHKFSLRCLFDAVEIDLGHRFRGYGGSSSHLIINSLSWVFYLLSLFLISEVAEAG